MNSQSDAHLADLLILSQQLAVQLPPDSMLSRTTRLISECLAVSCAGVYVRQLDGNLYLAVAHGESADELPSDEPDNSAEYWPILHEGEDLGVLAVKSIAPETKICPTDAGILSLLAGRMGQTVHTVRMTHDLRNARERLVLTREEERRKLRRNLHNSIGPTLAGLNLRVRSVQRTLQQDPQKGIDQMDELRKMIAAVINDIRGVIYDLRPPALDELGMLPAIHEQARMFRDGGLEVNVSSPDVLPPLPAALEVAIYRIISEALSNVARHSQASQCVVDMRAMPEQIEMTIDDDGIGLSSLRPMGVGTGSMREMANELGGRCQFEVSPLGGLRVRAVLPLGRLPILEES